MSEDGRKVGPARFDIVIAGAGILGAAIAWEATLRGAKVLLLERGDYGCGTSSNSLKIIHGGLRYLQSGNLLRARGSAQEQALLRGLAPHLVHAMPFVVPTAHGILRGPWAFRAGLAFYYRAIRWGLGPLSDTSQSHGLLSIEEFAEKAPSVIPGRAGGGAYWEDAQVFDPVRLVLEFVLSTMEQGGKCLNYMEVSGCIVDGGRVSGISVRDRIEGTEQDIECDVLVDATGVGVPGIPSDKMPANSWCKAVNLGLDIEPGDCSVGFNPLVGSNDDKRFLFLTPWRKSTIAGTWYFRGHPEDSDAMTLDIDEIDRCMGDLNSTLKNPVKKTAILFADIGYLPTTGRGGALSTALLEKDEVQDGGRFGVNGYFRPTGVKYTTARRFAEDIVDRCVGKFVSLGTRRSTSLQGAQFQTMKGLVELLRSSMPANVAGAVVEDLARRYGSRALDIAVIMQQEQETTEFIPSTNTTMAELQFVVRTEQVVSAADAVMRRTAMGAAGCPPDAAIEFVLDYLSQKRGWDAERRRIEADTIRTGYARIPPEALD